MKVPFLDLSRIDSELKEELKQKFAALLDKGVFSGGKEVDLFERSIQDKLKSRNAIACANGTDALELALRALQIGPGDEVIVPALTWVSTAEVVKIVGAKPIFWDSDEKGLLRADWMKAISKQTKAVIPVHLYGRMADMESICEAAKSSKIAVIEDVAQAFGTTRNGKAAGTWGDVGCLSYYPTKNLGALGEAGMCLTQDEEIAKKIRVLINHGQVSRDDHVSVGRNSRIDSIQAGFLNLFLGRFEAFQKRRKDLAKVYLEKLRGLPKLGLPEDILEEDHNAHLFVVETTKRDELRDFLKEKGIRTAIHYPKIIPDMEPYRSQGDFPNARKLTEQGLSLPLNPWITNEEVNYIADSVVDFFKL
ncbi:MAG: putative pyridoxal phosphate-dependent enzyme apparently involved in regulation of cell wall biogen [Algoriphagus marincola HL-49]|uniref:Putative pyridoxal phosphate-dependent enzyme apparently involved in regulation of cell wall biogen n=1 Tax=Algoriphagus marincola HL-49 TaxID=1305737 RepID=A0A0P7YJ29_9BACT|nr:MAG: putative pyridoxal phosphate-dependent enzyme apparently involved in regulation of cell wall biogen [Algoriphagus marincola HL-49]